MLILNYFCCLAALLKPVTGTGQDPADCQDDRVYQQNIPHHLHLPLPRLEQLQGELQHHHQDRHPPPQIQCDADVDVGDVHLTREEMLVGTLTVLGEEGFQVSRDCFL